MRPQQTLEILIAANVDEPFDYFSAPPVVNSIPKLKERIAILEKIAGFEQLIEFIKKSPPFGTNAASIDMPRHEWEILREKLKELEGNLCGLKKYLVSIVKNQHQESVFVRLPTSKDLAETAKYMEVFDKYMKQVVLKLDGRVRLDNCESGSIWLELNLGTPAAVTLIGGIAWAAAVVFKKVQEGRIHATYVESLKIKNDALISIQEAQKNLLDALVETEASNLSRASYGETADRDSIERVKATIREFSELIEKGAEIHPALEAPAEVKELFPDFKKLMSIEPRTKMISAGE